MQDTISHLEQTVSDFEQYSTAREQCTSSLSLANEKLGDSTVTASVLDTDTLQCRLETLRVRVFLLYQLLIC